MCVKEISALSFWVGDAHRLRNRGNPAAPLSHEHLFLSEIHAWCIMRHIFKVGLALIELVGSEVICN